jgi:hypothetical protein
MERPAPPARDVALNIGMAHEINDAIVDLVVTAFHGGGELDPTRSMAKRWLFSLLRERAH